MYEPKNAVRIVTATSLFDGHDVSINIMRRMLQDAGAEVVHLGHNRSVREIVITALQEGAQGIALSSYQGGHMEYFKYVRDLLDANDAEYVKIYGGGGGVIIYDEKKELEDYGIDQIFHPDDGQKLGLEGMIEVIIKGCDFDINEQSEKLGGSKSSKKEEYIFTPSELPHRDMGLFITALENNKPVIKHVNALRSFELSKQEPLILGITGTGGAGKSSLVDEVITRFLNCFENIKIAVICVDPSKTKTGGALLGDRIRMNSLSRDGVYMRSVASRGSGTEISKALPLLLDEVKTYSFDLVIVESSGIGQSSHAILEVCDKSLYVMTSEFGAQSQLEKIEMIDFADFVVINKADRRGALDAFRDVKKQYKRSRKLFEGDPKVPVFLTQASNFNDQGVNELFFSLTSALKFDLPVEIKSQLRSAEKQCIIPTERKNYLAEIVSTVKDYRKKIESQALQATELYSLVQIDKQSDMKKKLGIDSQLLQQEIDNLKESLGSKWEELVQFEVIKKSYEQDEFVFKVRGKEVRQPLTHESLSGTKIPRVVFPSISDWGDRLRFFSYENRPGFFPFTAGVFPLKRLGELPGRQFAGEGSPERTNRRFHYLSKNEKAKRLSTAFDSVTLYGQDPNPRPDIYGKVGESGVSIATLDDMKKLYAGFDLTSALNSVSMTINGPAPIMLAFFLNTAIDQFTDQKREELGGELSEQQKEDCALEAMQQVRGTVQADILKEDQGQNTCIFSIEFALKMMGDIQTYFTNNKIQNFYSVSISGYHIAEAGANPITQLAFTLSNAFTYVEYYLSRGLEIDDFAPNLSFFFSNGLDPEYVVIGRVARRIWAIVLRDKYGASDKSQKLKYHVQTSGRSLHAQEMQFNDIRTTLQALLALSDNCNSLHTNAYDEAITTPTEESVRRAQAIQLIINKEYGYSKNENPIQGSYFVEWLTDEVERAVLEEFLRINERGGVLGAMETQYQRSKIQEESMHYEHLKHSGSLEIVGVNTFQNPETQKEGYVPPNIELARAEPEEKRQQLDNVLAYQEKNKDKSFKVLEELKLAALGGENIFEALMTASKYCSLYQMTEALNEVGGQYRRNL
jgi:isobutyryl-CoA mutase